MPCHYEIFLHLLFQQSPWALRHQQRRPGNIFFDKILFSHRSYVIKMPITRNKTRLTKYKLTLSVPEAPDYNLQKPSQGFRRSTPRLWSIQLRWLYSMPTMDEAALDRNSLDPVTSKIQ